jgi:hypothetical protein
MSPGVKTVGGWSIEKFAELSRLVPPAEACALQLTYEDIERSRESQLDLWTRYMFG